MFEAGERDRERDMARKRCACVRERERERCACVRERDVRVVRERERGRERCVWSERERERERDACGQRETERDVRVVRERDKERDVRVVRERERERDACVVRESGIGKGVDCGVPEACGNNGTISLLSESSGRRVRWRRYLFACFVRQRAACPEPTFEG